MGLARLRLRDHPAALEHFHKAAMELTKLQSPPNRRCRSGDLRISSPVRDKHVSSPKAYLDQGNHHKDQQHVDRNEVSNGNEAVRRKSPCRKGDKKSTGEKEKEDTVVIVADHAFEASLHYHRWVLLP